MNKNSLLAFLLIAITVIFFNSSLWNNFWYGAILKKPVPTHQTQAQRRAEQSSKDNDSADIKVIPPGSPTLAGSSDSAGTATVDSLLSDHENIDADTAEVVQLVEDTVTVETNRFVAAISTKGARIISLKLKDYTYSAGSRKDSLVDVIPAGSVGGAQLSVNNESFDEVFFTVSDTGSITEKSDGHKVTLEAKSSDGKTIRKTFTFEDDTYKIGYIVSGNGVAGQKITLGWAGGVEDTESGSTIPFGGGMDKRRAHYSDGRSVDHFEMKKKGVEEPSGRFRWAGLSSKYIFIALVTPEVSDADVRIEGKVIGGTDKMQDIDYSVYYQSQAESNVVENWIYAGPNLISELSAHDLKFEKILFPVISWARHIFWADAWFPPLAEIILKVLQFFYGLVKDYGIAIFLLTLLSKLITFPMTHSSTKSMMRMRDLQPKLKAIQQKYKGNPQKMNAEVMAMYKSEGVNPLNPGCLPMFLQMPIFIALFVVLRKAIELRGASSFLLPWVKDLSLPEALFYLPGNGLPIYGNNVALMPILMAAVTFFQQKQVITDPNQKMMIYMMPILMLVMFNGFPAGVVFYWTVSSALGLLQQMWMKPKYALSNGATATVTTSSGTQKVPVKKSGGGSSSGKRKKK